MVDASAVLFHASCTSTFAALLPANTDFCTWQLPSSRISRASAGNCAEYVYAVTTLREACVGLVDDSRTGDSWFVRPASHVILCRTSSLITRVPLASRILPYFGIPCSTSHPNCRPLVLHNAFGIQQPSAPFPWPSSYSLAALMPLA